MPSLSLYITDDLYAKLLASGESPSALVRRLIEEYFAKVETQEVFEILKIPLWFGDVYVLLDKSKPKNEQSVMMSKDLKEVEAYLEKAKAMRKGK
jgi:hypothetical protein